MRKLVYFCDRCRRQTEKAYTIIVHVMNEDGAVIETLDGAPDLCKECFSEVNEAFEKIMQRLPMDVTQELIPQRPQKRKGANRAEIDMPKVFALRNAGWSYEKIADEFGCSAQTIVNHIREYEYEEGRKGKEAEE